MKLVLLPLLLATLLVGCSKQNESVVKEEILEFHAGVGIFTGNAEFGTIKT